MELEKKDTRIAVVIPVRNEAKNLEALLRSVLEQSPAADEVIVVDAGSTDETPQILNTLKAEFPSLHALSADGASPGRARNMAIASTDAEIIVQIDGGCFACDRWLSELVNPIRSGQADYVTGNVVAETADRKCLGETFDLGAVAVACVYSELRSESTVAGGGNAAYRREIWERTGGFPEWLRSGEDVLFAQKAADQRLKHEYAHSAVVRWQIGEAIADIFRRTVRDTCSNVLLDRRARNIRKLLVRNAIAAALACLAIFWFPALAILLLGAGALGLRMCAKSWRRYKARTEHPKGKRRVAALALIGRINAALLAAEEIGLAKGIYRRLTDRSYMSELKQYQEE